MGDIDTPSAVVVALDPMRRTKLSMEEVHFWAALVMAGAVAFAVLAIGRCA